MGGGRDCSQPANKDLKLYPTYDSGAIDPECKTPEISLQFVHGGNPLPGRIIRTNDGFPEEIFVKKKPKSNEKEEYFYYLGLEFNAVDGVIHNVEKNQFDQIVIKCENGTINKVSFVVESFSSFPDLVDIPNYVLQLMLRDITEGLTKRGKIVSDNKGNNICDITKEIINIENMYSNVKNISNYQTGSDVPSIKRFTIQVSAKNPNGITIDKQICRCKNYTVWKKLLGRTPGDDYHYCNFGDHELFRGVSRYFNNNADFYYRFTHPKARDVVDRRGITIYNGQEYFRVYSNRKELALSEGGIVYEVHEQTENMFIAVMDQAKKTRVQISFTPKTDPPKDAKIPELEPINLQKYLKGVGSDGGWNKRFQDDRQYISAHCYGLAIDINSDNVFNKRELIDVNNLNWREIELVIENLKYNRREENANNEIWYFFSYEYNTDNYENGKLKDEKKKRIINKIDVMTDEFNIMNGKALVNWFLYHLAFEPLEFVDPYVKFYWGGYFDPTDAMHFSLVESYNYKKKDEATSSYPNKNERKN